MRLSFSSPSIVLLLLQSFSDAAILDARNTTLQESTACASVHVIITRGTTEGYPGSLETLAELITANNPGTTYENIIYPATQETSSDSYSIGKAAASTQLSEYVKKCVDSKVVLLAYSQGALVMSDTLAGGSGDETLIGNATQPISESIGNHVAAIVLYGDPRHMPNQTYNVGNGTMGVTGKYPRTEAALSVLSTHYADKLQDYCNAGDPVCASGDDISAHLEYPQNFDDVASKWVQSKLDGC